jgi:hypothetical protein
MWYTRKTRGARRVFIRDSSILSENKKMEYWIKINCGTSTIGLTASDDIR